MTRISTRAWRCVCIVLATPFIHESAAAQSGGSVVGRVRTDAGAPASGVAARIEGTPLVQVTDAAGAFAFTGLAPGNVTLLIEQLGWQTRRHAVSVVAGEAARVELKLEPQALLLDQVVVTT